MFLSEKTHDVLAAIAEGHTTNPAIVAVTRLPANYVKGAIHRLHHRHGLLVRHRHGVYRVGPAGWAYLEGADK